MKTIEIILTILSSISGGLFIMTFVESLAEIGKQITNKIDGLHFSVRPSIWVVPGIWFGFFVLCLIILFK